MMLYKRIASGFGPVSPSQRICRWKPMQIWLKLDGEHSWSKFFYAEERRYGSRQCAESVAKIDKGAA
ncbi:hypothetical protein VNO80_30302 [Phaseolus coccineus]|uniref:Uncharacterized protein n=1 Tax=Phaseolus coccineus TaxID=3886 RepID=A0AAN9QFP4_PHACN